MKLIHKGAIVDTMQRYCARSPFITKLCVKLRNQANKVIGYHLAQSPDHLLNGEDLLLFHIAPHLTFAMDVGANTGEWTELLLSKYSSDPPIVHAFEPGPLAFAAIKARFLTRTNVVLNQQGVADKAGWLNFIENTTFNRTSSFLDLPTSGNKAISKVSVTTIDVYSAMHDIKQIDLLKIDCEGYDLKVLMGCEEMMSNGKIRSIQFEYGSGWRQAGSTLKAAYSLLIRNQYNVYVLSSKGLLPFNVDNFGEFFEYSNFFAIHSKFAEWVYKIMDSN